MKFTYQLSFNGDCAEAFEFYQKLFGGKLVSKMTWGESPMGKNVLYQALAEKGTPVMPLAETFWAKRFGMVVDRFGTPWLINCGKPGVH